MSTPIKPVNDATASLGTIHAVVQHRDAIHLAVEPVIAGEKLRPGMHIGLQNGVAFKADSHIKALGIVDPFLTKTVMMDEKFYLILFPRMITSLRHVWEHPDFDTKPEPVTPAEPVDEESLHKMRMLLGDPVALAKQVIMDVAAELNVEFEELMDQALQRTQNSWHYWVEGDKFEGESIPDKFWGAYETYTGTTVPSDSKGSFISCSC